MKWVRSISRTLAIGLVIAASITGVWACSAAEERSAVARFAKAMCISPERGADGQRVWRNTVALGEGHFVRVLSSGEMRSMFEVAFSDEDWRRQVTTFWDYSYPRDARLSPSTNTLWLVVSGGLGNLFDRAKLYEYDLATRTIAHDFDLEPADLPTPCPASRGRSP